MTTTDEQIKILLKTIKGQYEDTTKIQAIDELVQFGKKVKHTTSDMITIIENESLSFNLRAKAIWSLGELDSGSSVPPLLTLIQSSENHHIRILSLDALGKIAKRSAMVLPILTNLLETEQVKAVKLRIPKVIGKFGKDAIPVLFEIINSSSIDIKYYSLLALGEIKSESDDIALFLRNGMESANESDKIGFALSLLMQEGLESTALPFLEDAKKNGSITLGQQSVLDMIFEKVSTKQKIVVKSPSVESDLSISVLKQINEILFKKDFSNYNEFHVKNYADIVKKKETEQIEFKSSLRFNRTKQKVLSVLENKIINTIIGFMNAKGGILLIGVNNDGKIVGLDGDYKSLGKGRENSDGFQLRLNDLFENKGIKVPVLAYVDTFIEEIKKTEFCIVTVRPSKEPVFLKNKQSLIVRMGNSTRPLSTKEAIEYTLKRFSGGN